MWNENKIGRLVGYHRMDANQVFSQFQCSGESFSHIFVDKEMSHDAMRPELRKMIDFLQKDDLVVVESLHSLGYSFSDFQSVVRRILAKECAVQVRDENLMFSSKSDCGGQSMLRLLSAVARVERSMLSGLMEINAPTDTGEKASFKPNVRATASVEEAARIQEMKNAGVSTSVLQEEFGLSRGAINRILMASS